MLVWSAMGGGSISLPYLEREINGIPEPRLRIYGYLNEREYVHLCRESGIDPFAIVYEVQDWEFPAKFDENGKLTALNVTAVTVKIGMASANSQTAPATQLFRQPLRITIPRASSIPLARPSQTSI